MLSGADVEEGLEFEYGASIYYKLDSMIRSGLEFFGKMGEFVNLKSLDDQTHYIVPAFKIGVTEHISWNVGAAFGLTDASDDMVIKSIIGWEY